MDGEKIIEFSYNWNNKLDCKAFTTLRLTKKYNVGDIVKVKLKELDAGRAEVLGKKQLYLHKINDYIAYIDTGYDQDECRNILKRMYKNKGIDWITQPLYFYLLKRLKDD